MNYKRFTTPVRLQLEKWGLWPKREDFLKIFPKNAVGAELGVFQGKYSQKLLLVTKPKELHLIDPWWKVMGEIYGDWSRKHNNGELLPTRQAYEEAKAHVAAVDKDGVAKFHVEDDLVCLATFPDHYFDWIYLDSSHTYEHTKAELELLHDKVKPTGLIAGDDWKTDPNHMHYGMRVAIEEFCQSHDWEIKKLDLRFEQWCIVRKGTS